MLGLVLLGSSAPCDPGFQAEAELLRLAQDQSIPQWSKDGSQIIFSHPPSGIFVVQADGSRMWSLPPDSPMGTLISAGNFSPALSPDGSRVAYAMVVKANDSSEIVTSALDGSDLRKLTSNKALDAYPAWSPDGTQIAFYSARDLSAGFFHLYIMDSDGSDERSLVSSSLISTRQPPVWSPDGSRIAFVAFQRDPTETRRDIVHTVRPDGSGLTELGAAASSPAWSPDGTRIAFIREGDKTRGLYTMDPDGRDQRLLSSFSRDDHFWYNNLSWSPDGSQILYGVSAIGYPTPVVVVGVDGSEPRVLAERGSDWGRGGAAWSPDGSRIAFHGVSDHSDVVLHTTARDGSDERVLVRGNSERLVAERSDWRNVSGDIAACSGGYVVAKPEKNPGLVQDCETLLRVRDPLAGDAVLNWSADARISEWRGLWVEGSPPRITGLVLPRLSPSKLTGIIPPEMGDLTNLEVLSVQSNSLSGSIPPELGNLANLRELNLSFNRLEGPIPSELGRLTSLETMGLSGNRLAGGIPPEIGNLSNLKELWLRHNRLKGTIPLELGSLASLAVLEIGKNNLTGCVPAELSGRLRSLGTDGLEYC